MEHGYWVRDFDIAYFRLLNRLDSARRRLGFLNISHSDVEIARCAYRTVRAMEVFGSALETYAPAQEIPWMLCLRWRFLKFRQACNRRLRDLIAPGSKSLKGPPPWP